MRPDSDDKHRGCQIMCFEDESVIKHTGQLDDLDREFTHKRAESFVTIQTYGTLKLKDFTHHPVTYHIQHLFSKQQKNIDHEQSISNKTKLI